MASENSQIGKSGLRNEWSRTARGDLNFPLPLECELGMSASYAIVPAELTCCATRGVALAAQ
jgi:hypothetical protein